MADAASFEEKLIFQRSIKEKASKMFVLISESELMCFTKLCDSRYKMRHRFDQKREHNSKKGCLCPGSKIFRVVDRICRVRKTQTRLINNRRKDDD